MRSTPKRSNYSTLSGQRVNRPIQGDHFESWTSDLVFLQSLPITCFSQYFPISTVHTDTIYLQAKIPAGCHLLFVEIEYHTGSAVTATSSVTTITINGGSPTYFGSSPFTPSITSSTTRISQALRCFIDVSALGDTVATLAITWADTDTSNGTGVRGVRRIHVGTCPLSDHSPGAASGIELGIPAGNHSVGAPIVEGNLSNQNGFLTLFQQLDTARRLGQVRHLQWSGVTESVISTSSSSYADMLFDSANNPIWTVVSRRIYDTSTPNKYQLRVRHNTTNTATLTIKVTVTPAGGSPVSTEHTFTGTGSATIETSGTLQDLPTSGTGQECTIEFEFKVSSGTATISNLLLVEYET